MLIKQTCIYYTAIGLSRSLGIRKVRHKYAGHLSTQANKFINNELLQGAGHDKLANI